MKMMWSNERKGPLSNTKPYSVSLYLFWFWRRRFLKKKRFWPIFGPESWIIISRSNKIKGFSGQYKTRFSFTPPVSVLEKIKKKHAYFWAWTQWTGPHLPDQDNFVMFSGDYLINNLCQKWVFSLKLTLHSLLDLETKVKGQMWPHFLIAWVWLPISVQYIYLL